VVVSHDRHLLEMTADRLILIDEGTAREFDGSLDDYRDHLLGRGQAKARERDEAPKEKRGNKKEARRAAAEARERTKDLRTRARKAEQEMAKLTDQRSAIDRAMFDPDSAEVPYKNQGMTELMKTRGEIEKKLDAAEAVWLEASEALETAQAAE